MYYGTYAYFVTKEQDLLMDDNDTFIYCIKLLLYLLHQTAVLWKSL